MQQQQQHQQPPIDLKTTDLVLNSGEEPLFQQGFILRKVSKFVTGTTEDSLISIPIFYDPKTFKIYEQSMPKEIRDDYKEFYKEES